jgi:hypothetical protein
MLQNLLDLHQIAQRIMVLSHAGILKIKFRETKAISGGL